MSVEHKPGASAGGHRTANRILDILELLAITPDGCALKDISKQLQAPKSSLFPLLGTLCDRGYIAQDYHGTYRLGTRLLEISVGVNKQMNLRDIAHPELRALAVKTGESVILSRLTSDRKAVVYLDKVETFRRARASTGVGESRPLHATSSGKLLLALLPEAEREAVFLDLEMPPYTEHTVTDKTDLMAEIATIRERGYAVSVEQLTKGYCAVAVPIYDSHGEVVAACVVSAPCERGLEIIPSLAEQLTVAAGRISRQLGYRD